VNTPLPRILLIHNRYRQPGGEDVVVAAQSRLLREKGHDVEHFEKDNRTIDGYNLFQKAALFFNTADNSSAAAEVAALAHHFKPDVAFVHNTLPLLSPSIYAPLQKAGVKIIQWLHNYRLVCPAGTLFRDGTPCTLCVDGGLAHAVKHRCWTGSKLATLALTRMLERHRRAETFKNRINLFVALNSYQRDLLVEHQIVRARNIVVQPNFIFPPSTAGFQPASIDSDTGQAGCLRYDAPGDGFIMAGRLTPEKGIASLVEAAATLNKIRVQIIGDGPLYPDAVAAKPNVDAAGRLPREETMRRIATSRALIFPSLWPEGCPTTIIEAMALGRAVIAARVPGALELVTENVNGLLFDPGNATQLAACIQKLHDDPALASRLGQVGRERYLKEFTPDAGYERLMALCLSAASSLTDLR